MIRRLLPAFYRPHHCCVADAAPHRRSLPDPGRARSASTSTSGCLPRPGARAAGAGIGSISTKARSPNSGSGRGRATRLATIADRLTRAGRRSGRLRYAVSRARPACRRSRARRQEPPGVDPATLPDYDAIFADSADAAPLDPRLLAAPGRTAPLPGRREGRASRCPAPIPSASIPYLTGVAAPLPALRDAARGPRRRSASTPSHRPRRYGGCRWSGPMAATCSRRCRSKPSASRFGDSLRVVVFGDTAAAGLCRGRAGEASSPCRRPRAATSGSTTAGPTRDCTISGQGPARPRLPPLRRPTIARPDRPHRHLGERPARSPQHDAGRQRAGRLDPRAGDRADPLRHLPHPRPTGSRASRSLGFLLLGAAAGAAWCCAWADRRACSPAPLLVAGVGGSPGGCSPSAVGADGRSELSARRPDCSSISALIFFQLPHHRRRQAADPPGLRLLRRALAARPRSSATATG